MSIQVKKGGAKWSGTNMRKQFCRTDSPGCFELTEFTFYTGYNEYYDKIPVFELKLTDGQYDAVLRFEDVRSARLDDLESITDIHLDISPVDSGWESIRYYVDDGKEA